MKEKECIFCRIIKKEIPAKLVDETDNFIAILDVNPKAEGHTLIIFKIPLCDSPGYPFQTCRRNAQANKKNCTKPKTIQQFQSLS